MVELNLKESCSTINCQKIFLSANSNAKACSWQRVTCLRGKQRRFEARERSNGTELSSSSINKRKKNLAQVSLIAPFHCARFSCNCFHLSHFSIPHLILPFHFIFCKFLSDLSSSSFFLFQLCSNSYAFSLFINHLHDS